MPWSLEWYKDGRYDYTTVVDGSRLEEHSGLLMQIIEASSFSTGNDFREDVRMYYVFENKNGRNVFDVAMWSGNGKIVVNGVEVENNHVFYELLIHFLPEDLVKRITETGLALDTN